MKPNRSGKLVKEPKAAKAQTWPIPEAAKLGAAAIDEWFGEQQLKYRAKLDALGVEVCKGLGLDPLARNFRVDFAKGLVTDLGPKEK